MAQGQRPAPTICCANAFGLPICAGAKMGGSDDLSHPRRRAHLGQRHQYGRAALCQRAEDCPYEIVLVASNNPDAGGLKLAAAEGVPTFALPHKGMAAPHHDACDGRRDPGQRRAVCRAGGLHADPYAGIRRRLGRPDGQHPSLAAAQVQGPPHPRPCAGGWRQSWWLHGPSGDRRARRWAGAGPDPGGDAARRHADSLAARVLIAEHQLYSRCLAALVSRETSPEWLTAQVRNRAMALPEAEETLSHGMPCFGIIKGKKFAWVSLDHHGDGKTALLVKISGPEEQAAADRNGRSPLLPPALFRRRLDRRAARSGRQ
jgi:phosphoribosylglycinamide formyltransferase-1